MRIDDYSSDLRKVADSEGYVYQSRGGYGYHYGDPPDPWSGSQSSCSTSGCDPELIPQAIASGAVVIDTTTISDADIWTFIGAPIPENKYHYMRVEGCKYGRATLASDSDWTHTLSISYCDVRMYAVLAFSLGATLHNTPTPTAEELSKANAYWAASKARSEQYRLEREAKRAAENAALELDNAG